MLCLAPPVARLNAARLWMAAIGLGIAGAARAQVAPTVLILAFSVLARRRRAGDAVALLPVAVFAAVTIGVNLAWFGHPLGPLAGLEATLHPRVHGVSGALSDSPWTGALGLLVSPSRGLLVFSPVVLTALAGLGAARREGWQIDLLPLLVPLAAAGTGALRANRLARAAATGALAWSIGLAATGAFSYPAEAWNARPVDVDLHHDRLWDWRDPQFVRCWRTGLSPQNMRLFAVRPASTLMPAPHLTDKSGEQAGWAR